MKFYILLDNVNGIKVYATAYFKEVNNQIFTPFVDDFNDYAIKNNLNITLELYIFSNKNSAVSYSDYESMLEYLFKKKSIKYDIIFYDSIYISKLGKYFLNLKDLLPEEHVNMYKNIVLKDFCYYDNSLVGLVNLFIK